MQRRYFYIPASWGLVDKRSYIIQSQLQSQFQRFLNQTLCVFSQMKDIKHIRRDFHSVPWVAGGQAFNFLNMVMWHIKLKGMSSSPGYTE